MNRDKQWHHLVYWLRHKLWSTLTEPSPAIQQPERQRQARLLSMLVLPLTLFCVLAIFTTSSKTDAIGLALLVPILSVTYWISRTRYYLAAGILVVVLISLGMFSSLLVTTDFTRNGLRSELKWLALPIVFGSLCLPLKIMIPIVLAELSGILLAPVFFSDVAIEFMIEPFIFIGIISLLVLITTRTLENDQKQIEFERHKSEKLLLNILPKPIADILKESPEIVAHEFDAVTILFADIVGFTTLASHIPASEVVGLLNEIFSRFDTIADRYGLEKIKTIGDAYMVAGGLPTFRPDHVEAIAKMALDLRRELAAFNTGYDQPLDIRIGIHTGPGVAGVIGIRKFIYDVWGDTVNIASRMESHGIPGKIQVSEITYELLKDRYVLEERGMIEIKGRGQLKTYFLEGKK